VAYPTDADVKSRLADALGLDSPADLPAPLADVASAANLEAKRLWQGEMVAGRGYTQAQAETADQAFGWVADMAVYFALLRAGGSTALTDAQLARFDRRKELPNLGLTYNGDAVDPGDPAAAERGGVGSGAFDTAGMTFGPDVEW
jgi:hypothetical protein